MGQKVIIKVWWWESGLSSAFGNHLITFCRPSVHNACLRLCSAVVHFILKQLSLFCLLRLISACADQIGYITNFCSVIDQLHEFKNSFF